MNTDIQQFIDINRAVLAQSENCEESQALLAKAKTLQDIKYFWQSYINGIVTEVPEQVLSAFEQHWAEYGEALNRCGIRYNEDGDRWDLCIIGNTDKVIHLDYHAKAYVLGKAKVIAHECAQVYCFSPEAHIVLKGSSFGNIHKGTVETYNYATCIKGE